MGLLFDHQLIRSRLADQCDVPLHQRASNAFPRASRRRKSLGRRGGRLALAFGVRDAAGLRGYSLDDQGAVRPPLVAIYVGGQAGARNRKAERSYRFSDR